jgi:hypothetical protein
MSAEPTQSADVVTGNGPPRVETWCHHERDIRAIIAKNEDIASEAH